ncbi:hypothetical protein [Saprospira grandis]|nr:hypothetical protein [Saprospira grandis]
MNMVKRFVVYVLVVALYVFLLLISLYTLAKYEWHYAMNEAVDKGEFYAIESFNNSEYFSYLLYKYFLNFPLSIFNWFFSSTLYLTAYLTIPNAIVVAWFINTLMQKKKKKYS